MPSHTFILSMGHRNTDGGGAVGERAWTPGATRMLKEAIRARGGKAFIIQEEAGGPDPEFFDGGLQAAARACVDLASNHGPFDAYISMHYNGTGSNNSSGFHAIFPDGHGGEDVKANNPLDVKLSRAMRDRVKESGSVGILGWTADSPGVMSEHETRVGSQGNRLGEMFGTAGFRSTTARVIVEAGNISNPREASLINSKSWVRDVYCESLVTALEDVFGAFSDRPQVPGAEPGPFEKPEPLPELVQFRERPDEAIPAALFAGGQWYWWIGRNVTATKQTPRNKFAEEDSPPVGPPLEPGETFYAAFGSTAPNGRPFTHTFWGTRIWLDDTDFGMPE